ncbi:hypothetical protein KQX54_018056 [Cotesia glomerata]|uniref:Uncharacterized protein n=1 Tax=Cotesia glomerata TaxID=32391 RepID=A0AAV7I5L5_COTGL|nr:hypothetical protein KQX54_018056 [Cotesia glomerata]
MGILRSGYFMLAGQKEPGRVILQCGLTHVYTDTGSYGSAILPPMPLDFNPISSGLVALLYYHHYYRVTITNTTTLCTATLYQRRGYFHSTSLDNSVQNGWERPDVI